MPRERWDALVRGEDCPLCHEVQSVERANEFGSTVADLRFSRLRLVRNQYVQGYCVLICHKHVAEPCQLSLAEQRLFFDDMLQVGQALEQVFGPVKLNFEILGNAVPHLHAHIKPRYYGDDRPGMPIWADAKQVILTDENFAARVRIIRESLGLVSTNV